MFIDAAQINFNQIFANNMYSELLYSSRFQIVADHNIVRSRKLYEAVPVSSMYGFSVVNIGEILNLIREIGKFNLVNINVRTNKLAAKCIDMPELSFDISDLSISLQLYMNNSLLRFEDMLTFSLTGYSNARLIEDFYCEWRWLIDYYNKCTKINSIHISRLDIEKNLPVLINRHVTGKLLCYMKKHCEKTENYDLISEYFRPPAIAADNITPYGSFIKFQETLNMYNSAVSSSICQLLQLTREDIKQNNNKSSLIDYADCLILYYIDNEQTFDFRTGSGEVLAYFARIADNQIQCIYSALINISIKQLFSQKSCILNINNTPWILCTFFTERGQH